MAFSDLCRAKAPTDMIPLDFDFIKASTFGAAWVEEVPEGMRFHRFTPEQETIWREHSENFFKKSQCPAGVRIEFDTDSREIWLEIEVAKGTTENYFSLEVYRNGEWVGNIVDSKCVDGVYSARIVVHSGMKRVRIDLPWSVNTTLHGLYVLADKTVTPAPRKAKRAVFLGDSITQGYLAHNTSFTFPSLTVEAMGDVEGFNKGLGGAIFDPRLGSYREDFEPDYVFTNFGTNNWAHTSRENFDLNCPAFFKALAKTYPNSKLYCVTPLWRKDEMTEFPCGNFRKFCDDIAHYAEAEGITVIRGEKLFPHNPELYGDYRLHPNDRGFAILAGILATVIAENE